MNCMCYGSKFTGSLGCPAIGVTLKKVSGKFLGKVRIKPYPVPWPEQMGSGLGMPSGKSECSG